MGAGGRVGHRLSGPCPRGFVRFGRVWFLIFAGLDDREGEVLEAGEQCAESFRVVEQGLPVGEFGLGEPAGDGLAADPSGPFGVGGLQRRRAARWGGGGGGVGGGQGLGGGRGAVGGIGGGGGAGGGPRRCCCTRR